MLIYHNLCLLIEIMTWVDLDVKKVIEKWDSRFWGKKLVNQSQISKKLTFDNK
jgi:hypothetical protein